MAELKHPQQQWPGNRPTRSATKRPQSRPLILLPLASNTGRDKGLPTWRQAGGDEHFRQAGP
jgi:hypothetical protein